MGRGKGISGTGGDIRQPSHGPLTGIAALDTAIERFATAKLPGGMTVKCLRDPTVAEGQCVAVADVFTRLLRERGLEAHSEFQDDEDEPHGNAWGYDDRTRNPGWGNHCLTTIAQGGALLSVDWTAAQFGYGEFPLVQKLVDGRWQRLR